MIIIGRGTIIIMRFLNYLTSPEVSDRGGLIFVISILWRKLIAVWELLQHTLKFRFLIDETRTIIYGSKYLLYN